jgi:transcriptional regulator with XRE-family HTH domain
MRADDIKKALEGIDLGERVVAFRLQKGWSQGELARALEMTHPYLSQLENDRMVPSPRMVRKLAYVFDTTTEDLLRGPLPTRSGPSKPKAVA